MDDMEATPMQHASNLDHSKPAIGLDAPALTHRHVTLANRLSARRQPIAFGMNETVLSFHPTGLASTSSEIGTSGNVGLALSIDGRPAGLRLPRGLFERILERVEPELLVADLHDDLLPLLLESCLAAALKAAETALQGRIELQKIEPDMAIPESGLEIQVEIAIDGDEAGRASLHIDEPGAERLAALFDRSPKNYPAFRNLEAELSFRAGSMWLGLGELRSLKVGDVLLADEDPAQADEIAATLGEKWLLNAEFMEAGLTLTKPLRPATIKDRDLWMMDDKKHPSAGQDGAPEFFEHGEHAAGTPEQGAGQGSDSRPADPVAPSEPSPAHRDEDARFEELPIKVVFELGRVEISLGRLQDLGPGHVFKLDRPIGEAVDVYAGGRRVGQGEVVKIDEQVGVRMVRLFGNG